MKNQGKPEIVMQFSIILMEVRENKLCSSHISFINSLTHTWLFAKWLFYLLSVNVNLNTLYSAIANSCTSIIYKAPFSLLVFVNV